MLHVFWKLKYMSLLVCIRNQSHAGCMWVRHHFEDLLYVITEHLHCQSLYIHNTRHKATCPPWGNVGYLQGKLHGQISPTFPQQSRPNKAQSTQTSSTTDAIKATPEALSVICLIYSIVADHTPMWGKCSEI